MWRIIIIKHEFGLWPLGPSESRSVCGRHWACVYCWLHEIRFVCVLRGCESVCDLLGGSLGCGCESVGCDVSKSTVAWCDLIPVSLCVLWVGSEVVGNDVCKTKTLCSCECVTTMAWAICV